MMRAFNAFQYRGKLFLDHHYSWWQKWVEFVVGSHSPSESFSVVLQIFSLHMYM